MTSVILELWQLVKLLELRTHLQLFLPLVRVPVLGVRSIDSTISTGTLKLVQNSNQIPPEPVYFPKGMQNHY